MDSHSLDSKPSTKLNAATILLVVLVGGAIGGVLGWMLAIPFTACLQIMEKELLLPRLRAWGTWKSLAMTSHSTSPALNLKQGAQPK